LVWGRNVGEVLDVADPAALHTGRDYTLLVDPKSGSTRFRHGHARATSTDRGAGVPYQVQYALRAEP